MDRARQCERLLIMDRDTVFYLGLPGQPSNRALGAITLYVSLSRPFALSIENSRYQEASAAVVPPYVLHSVVSAERLLGTILIEPELRDVSAVLLAVRNDGFLRGLPARVDAVRAKVLAGEFPNDRLGLEELLFDTKLPRSALDERVRRIVERMRRDPCLRFSARNAAGLCGLSTSRFMHLFKEQTGVAFRRMSAWKRARVLLEHVDCQHNLTDIALRFGYADLPHFSHSIRQFYGLNPRNIVAGSRGILLLNRAGSAEAPVW